MHLLNVLDKGNVSVLPKLIGDFETFSNNLLAARNSIYWVWFLKILIFFVFCLEEEMKKRGGVMVVALKHFFFAPRSP